ncbi:hypothetical protein BDY24DRAFT_135257 [Mrakia frigida]|uniref:uncharacterized protein n=1 Tax=Mrakia frigida TaxID=29902 RepID=UPI003FCC19F4
MGELNAPSPRTIIFSSLLPSLAMALPHLPDDILSEIFSHFFGSTSVATPISPPTPVKGSTSLLLTSKPFRTLSLPLFWRSITIHKPSDFVSLFDPKIGLLHAKGKVGKERRGWIQTLSFGREAAVPLSLDRITRESFDTAYDREGDHNLFVKLSPVKLPNLQHLSLAVVSYIWDLDEEEDPAFLELARKLEESSEKDWNWIKEDMDPEERELAEAGEMEGSGFRDILFSMGIWKHLARRNDEIISSLLSINAKQIRTLQLGVENSVVKDWKDPRLPSSIQEAENLVVTLFEPVPSFFTRWAPELPSQVASHLHETAMVQIYHKEESKGRVDSREV